MRRALFCFMSDNPGSVIPSTRIARYVRDKLKVPTFWNDPAIADFRGDVLIIVNGAYAFCKVLPELAEAIRRVERVVWIQNDYTVIPPKRETEAQSPFRKAFNDRRLAKKSHIDFWSTCRASVKASELSTYVNWNALTYAPLDERTIATARREASDRMIYYGSFRHDGGNKTNSRLAYFDRYFRGSRVPVTISSPDVKDKFRERYPDVEHLPKFPDLVPAIARYGCGLYIEDRASHGNFHSPANRIYEMLSAGLPIIFQPEAIGMLSRAGMEVEPWTAMTPGRVAELHARRDEMGAEQRALRDVAARHRADLDSQLDEAVFKLRGAR